MKDRVRELFPGSNTCNGFYSYFDYIIPKNVNRIFCLKGGPGVGKSSLMRKIGKEFISKGYNVELHYCTSDPSSLDAVVVMELGIVMLDATAPHIVDPKTPGAIDEIVNLGDYWEVEELEKNKEGIKEISDDISRSFQRAYKYLKAAEPIYRDIEEKHVDCMNFGEVNKISEKIIKDLLGEIEASGEYVKERHLAGSAFTPIGHVDYTDSILNNVEKVVHIKGDIGTGKTTLLNKIYSRAKEKGLYVEVYHSPMMPSKLETVIIRDLNVAYTISDIFKDRECIDLDKYLNEDRLRMYQSEIDYDKRVMEELIEYALYNISMAKEKHDVIENYYVPNMNFDKIEKLKDELIQRMLRYE